MTIGRTAENQTGTGRLYDNDIDRYQKGGVYVDNEGSYLEARDNTIRGDGPPHDDRPERCPDQPQRRCQGGGQPRRGQRVHRACRSAGQASGFILFNVAGTESLGRIKLEDNLVRENDTNIGLYNTDRALIEDNRTLDAVFYDGLYADDESTHNRFEDNRAFGNTEHDCHDDSQGNGTAGTANHWDDNEGRTDTPDGICKRKRPTATTTMTMMTTTDDRGGGASAPPPHRRLSRGSVRLP